MNVGEVGNAVSEHRCHQTRIVDVPTADLMGADQIVPVSKDGRGLGEEQKLHEKPIYFLASQSN